MPIPPPSRKWYGWPMASGMTRMSENRMAASISYLLSGCMVTSVASSGDFTISVNEYDSLSLRYSGRYLPAWRMTQTGGLSSGWQFTAAKNLSLLFMVDGLYWGDDKCTKNVS